MTDLEKALGKMRKFFIGAEFDDDTEMILFAVESLKDLVKTERRLNIIFSKIDDFVREAKG